MSSVASTVRTEQVTDVDAVLLTEGFRRFRSPAEQRSETVLTIPNSERTANTLFRNQRLPARQILCPSSDRTFILPNRGLLRLVVIEPSRV
jgi:hypothetical protein